MTPDAALTALRQVIHEHADQAEHDREHREAVTLAQAAQEWMAERGALADSKATTARNYRALLAPAAFCRRYRREGEARRAAAAGS